MNVAGKVGFAFPVQKDRESGELATTKGAKRGPPSPLLASDGNSYDPTPARSGEIESKWEAKWGVGQWRDRERSRHNHLYPSMDTINIRKVYSILLR